MNELIYRLTSHTIMDVQLTWNELCAWDFQKSGAESGAESEGESGYQRACSSAVNGCAKLADPWITSDYMGEDAGGDLFFSLPNNRIWRFRREYLKDREPFYIQLEATDTTELYRHSKELYENNRRLAEQYGRQQRLLENIVGMNREKEILSIKMRIHDDLGRSILATKQHLSGDTLSGDLPHLAETWNNTIRSLENFAQISADAQTSPETELQKAADMVGCHIKYKGERPDGRKAALLFYAAVREALTNAVRHAGAYELTVATQPTALGYHIEISDNGRPAVSPVVEGGGLSNLRKRLEQQGATLEVRCKEGVVLVVKIPHETKNTSEKEGG